ncbi:MAG TPA: CDP-alcohol phosphatidyltransferase family protein [Candidatus Bipolaricaulota bacterium]|nr:CDP-alcohol phosphatidyltransferase family protein [Candidatus Bipolaricaulota bacterium]
MRMIAKSEDVFYAESSGIDNAIRRNRVCAKIHPIIITLVQLPLLMVAVWLYFRSQVLMSCLLIGAVIWPLDLLDGKFARIFNKQTQAGAFLDPLVDKIRFLVPLTLFFSKTVWLPLIIAFWLIESGLVVCRVFKLLSAKKLKKRAKISAFPVGKVKSWGEMIGLLLIYLFAMTDLTIWLILAYIVLIPSLALACASLFRHIKE